MTEPYDVGDQIRLEPGPTGVFANSAGTPTDPTTVTLTIRKPDGTSSSAYLWARSGVGEYHYDLTIDQAGTWYHKWDGDGALVVSFEGTFDVRTSSVLQSAQDVLDATVGGAWANTYLDVAAADVFAAGDIGPAAMSWMAADTGSKERALKRATREIDNYLRTSGLARFSTVQALLYPRAGDVLTTLDVLSSSVANPSVITTRLPHGFTTGQTVVIAGHVGSSPTIDGSRVITVTGARTFTIPVNVTTAGTGGTVSNASVPLIPYLPSAIRLATWAQAKFLNANASVLDAAETRRARGVDSASEPNFSYSRTGGAPTPLLCDEALGYLKGASAGASTIRSVVIGTDYSYPQVGYAGSELLP